MAQVSTLPIVVRHSIVEEPGDLFWSIRGEVACAGHVPPLDSRRWSDEGWRAIPPGGARHGIRYQCQHCAPDRSPIARRRNRHL
jgi:hypothetical protein